MISSMYLRFCFAGLMLANAVLTTSEDPCLDYTIKREEYKRSTQYEVAPGVSEINDRTLDFGWYRFIGPQGSDMPTDSPGIDHCGCENPVWLNGDLPVDFTDTIVQRSVCVESLFSTCSSTWSVQIKVCQEGTSTYRIYNLIPTQNDKQAYCIGTELKCPDGESSPNFGYTPGCTDGGFPQLYSTPVIRASFVESDTPEGAVIRKYILMQADFEHNETDVLLRVDWFKDDLLLLFSEDNLPYENLPAVLHELDWNVDKGVSLPIQLSVEITAKYTVDGPLSNTIRAEYFMGFVIKDKLITVVTNEISQLNIRPTVPILCPLYNGMPRPCTLSLTVYEPYSEDGQDICPGRQHVRVQSSSSATNCKIKIPEVTDVSEDEWFATNVTGTLDNVYDPSTYQYLVMKTDDHKDYHPPWGLYDLPPVEVLVVDEEVELQDKFCYLYNDPHMNTFDGQVYHMQLEGEFIVYKHLEFDIEIQGMFKSRGSYSQLCGMAIRNLGDLFIFETSPCDNSRVHVYQCDNSKLKIKTIEAGYYEVTVLTTGLVVRVKSGYAWIHPSQKDYGQTEGLCGTLDGNVGNEYKKRDGTYYPIDELYPNEFSNSWRVQMDERLYFGDVPEGIVPPPEDYCGCGPDEDLITCGEFDECSPGDGVELDLIEKCEKRGISKRRKRDTGNIHLLRTDDSIYGDDVEEDVVEPVYNISYEPPPPTWMPGWTETKAREVCEAAIITDALTNCMDLVDVEPMVDSCIDDIHVTGNTEFVDFYLDDIILQCKGEILKNTSLYTFTNSSGETEAIPPVELLSNLCPMNCSGQGYCEDGSCKCNPDAFGLSCEWNINKVPDIKDIQSNGLCDIRSRPCLMTPVKGDYFLQTNNLTCAFTKSMLFKNNSVIDEFAIYQVPGEYDHSGRVLCPFPEDDFESYDDDLVSVGYNVSVSNNGQQFSEFKPLAVYDSICMECTKDLNCSLSSTHCVLKATCYADGEASDIEQWCVVCNSETDSFKMQSDTCLIDNRCFNNLEKHSTDPCLLCNVEQSAFTWSKDDACNDESTKAWPIVLGCLGGSVAVITLTGVVVGLKKRKNKVNPSNVNLVEAEPAEEKVAY